MSYIVLQIKCLYTSEKFSNKEQTMKWYNYLFAFLTGMFLANAVPHFVNGVSGNEFPSPFADPIGKGPTSPVVNVAWGLANILIAYAFYYWGKVTFANKTMLLLFFIGAAIVSLMLASAFADKLTHYK